jgi:hypothetical protein
MNHAQPILSLAATRVIDFAANSHYVEVLAGLVLPKDVRHDLRKVGTEPLLAVAFFSGKALTQTFDSVMLPPNSHVLSSPNA